MKITWNDISSHLALSDMLDKEPDSRYKEIFDFLQYWIPSIIPDTKVTINGVDSYQYDSKNKYLWIDYTNIWSVFESKYGMKYSDIQVLITGYAMSTHNIEVKHTWLQLAWYHWQAMSTHNIEVKHTKKVLKYLIV
jgi:hypothetical protein